jgi:hypothetical protein
MRDERYGVQMSMKMNLKESVHHEKKILTMKGIILLKYEDFLSQLANNTHNTIFIPSATADNFNRATNVTLASTAGPISQPGDKLYQINSQPHMICP